MSDEPAGAIEAEILESLLDPRISLLAYAKVMDQKQQREVSYDPFAITERLQATILSYFADPPIRSGQTAWLSVLGYRQGGKSLTAELAPYVITAYTPGWQHTCIADIKDRAEYLHTRVHYTHQRWPDALRSPTVNSREVRQLTFDPQIGGKMNVLSGEVDNVGIGLSPDSFHMSESPFWNNTSKQLGYITPSLINRDRALVINESTPAPADASSVEWAKEHYAEAKRGEGRWIYAFFPFWDGKLNRRDWPAGSALDSEEERLLTNYAAKGLRKEHLAFRRWVISSDQEFRRNPELFNVFYPFDDITCWLASVHGAISADAISKCHNRSGVTTPWRGDYMEYEAPQPGAIYVLGGDPAGWGIRDHASFHVLKIYRGSWKQVACFSANDVDPLGYAQKVEHAALRYNKALVVLESNGVGAAALTFLINARYPRLYYEAEGKPGKTSTSKSNDELLAGLTDALLDDLVLKDEDTFAQVQTYKNDKKVEDSPSTLTLRAGALGRRRRGRHHWDKVSALMMACFGAAFLPQRVDPSAPVEARPVVGFLELGYDAQRKYIAAEEKRESKSKTSLVYRSVRGRR